MIVVDGQAGVTVVPGRVKDDAGGGGGGGWNLVAGFLGEVAHFAVACSIKLGRVVKTACNS